MRLFRECCVEVVQNKLIVQVTIVITKYANEKGLFFVNACLLDHISCVRIRQITFSMQRTKQSATMKFSVVRKTRFYQHKALYRT